MNKKMILLIGMILITSISLISCSKDHDIAIYVENRLGVSDKECKKIIKAKDPVLTDKDIKNYNEKYMMFFLKEDVLADYIDAEEIDGGSLFLDVKGTDNTFIIAVDGKFLCSGVVQRGEFIGNIEGKMIIKDALGGLRLYAPDDMNSFQKEQNRLKKVFKDMEMLTDKVFYIKNRDIDKVYDTNKLWKNKISDVKESIKLEEILRNLHLEYTGFNISIENNKNVLEIIMKEGVKHPYVLCTDGYMLLDLVENLSRVDFLLDEKPVAYIIDKSCKEIFSLDDIYTMYYEKNISNQSSIFDFYKAFEDLKM